MTTSAGALDLDGGPISAISRPDFARLMTAILNTPRASWVFAIYNHVVAREQVVDAMRQMIEPLPVFQWTYSPESPNPADYLDSLTPEQRRSRAVVCIYDFERVGDDVWRTLDYNREVFTRQPHTLVFWVSQSGRRLAPRLAPHFWSQASGAFDFTLPQTDTLLEMRETAAHELLSRAVASFGAEELAQRIRLLTGLLDELMSVPSMQTLEIARLRLRLSEALLSADRYQEARTQATIALDLAVGINDLQLAADCHKRLGDLSYRQADLNGARAEYEAALGIYPAIGDRLGEANVRKALGDLLVRENDLKGARAEYESALQIYPETSARNGEAGVLLSLGLLAIAEGQLLQAADATEKAAELFRQVKSGLVDAGTIEKIRMVAVSVRRFAEFRLKPQTSDSTGQSVLTVLAKPIPLRAQASEFYALGMPTVSYSLLDLERQIWSLLGNQTAVTTIEDILAQVWELLSPDQRLQIETARSAIDGGFLSRDAARASSALATNDKLPTTAD